MGTQIRLVEACETFFLDNAARRLTKPSQGYYTASLRQFTRWCDAQGVALLADVTPAHLRRYLVALQERTAPRGQPLSSAYVHNLMRAVRRFFAFCVEDGMLERTPFRAVKLPQVERKVLLSLTSEEVRRALRVCTTERDRALVLFLLDTGARAAEACSLTVGAVDMGSGAVTVERGKGQKGRYVFMGAAARKALRLYLATRGSPGPAAPLFTAQGSERPLTVNALVQLMLRLQERSGVPHLTAHALRRTFAINCLRNGMDIHTLRVLMGHTDLDVLRAYLDFAQADLQTAHAKASPVDRLLK